LFSGLIRPLSGFVPDFYTLFYMSFGYNAMANIFMPGHFHSGGRAKKSDGSVEDGAAKIR